MNHFIAWWNLENLFDIQNSKDRPEWLQTQLESYLKGWTQTLLDKKLANQASIINKLNNGAGPDIMGFCEIENRKVIEELISAMKKAGNGRDYGIVHEEMNDDRGIDIAFIYDRKKYTVGKKDIFSAAVMKRTATRDLLQATFTVKKSKRQFILIGNHWPARSAGQYESEPFRIIVAETLAYWLQRIAQIKGEQMPVVCVGDFNDEPFNRSLADYANSTDSVQKVINASKPKTKKGNEVRTPYLLNLMWKMLGQNRGTFVFSGDKNMLDQFLVNRAIVADSEVCGFRAGEADIIDYIPEMVKGSYKSPRKFGKPSDDLDETGYSDHLPITFILEETE
ncbi:MAG: endonuclease/exonuclease/phosphatase [Bacteroidia bacterium]|nr:endonuclease/exonuclease/phosphatase [Bacteroidia bacterium]